MCTSWPCARLLLLLIVVIIVSVRPTPLASYGRVALLFAICLTGASAHIGMLAALPADKQPWYLNAIKFIAHTNEARPIHERVYSCRRH